MRRTAYILLLTLISAAVVIAINHKRHRSSQPAQLISATADDSPTDVAATLRMLSDSQVNDESKGWSTRFADFVNAHPGRQWIVGSCDRPCLSESEAAASARADAARKLYPVIARRLAARASDAPLLRQLIWTDVQNNKLESDRFAEQFTRPYGKVWTESVLLDVSPDRIQPLADHYRNHLDAEHLQARRRAGLGGFAIAATAALYLLLNSLTRGYFTFRLRLTAMLIAAAILILIV
jgi:hypothetical protein